MSSKSISELRPGRCLQLTKFYPPFNGGIETTVRDISTGLTQRGWFVDVLCSNDQLRTVHEPGTIGVTRVASLAQIASTSISPMLVPLLARCQAEHDVIHVHLPNPMANLALWLTRPSAKIVLHWHSDIIKQKRLLKLYEPLQSWLLNRSDAILATSSHYASSSPWLRMHMNKVHIAPSCIEDPLVVTTVAHRKAKTELIREAWPNKRIVFALGRMTYYKGFDVLIEATHLLPDDVVVLIGGAGELLEPLRQQVRNAGLTHKIQFLGRVSEEDLAGYFCAADLFCLPSVARSEAFGLVMVEAMGYAKPVVATDIEGSGVPWVNLDGESGLNAKPGDAPSLANRILCILDDPALASRLGSGARLRFESLFTFDRMIDVVETTYAAIGVNSPSKAIIA
jgi:glycosyltransferase involved in cell wall biosynthesis